MNSCNVALAMIGLAMPLAAAIQPDDKTDLAHRLYRAQMAAAESALRLSEFGAARTWLAETDPASRGFEWRAFEASLNESTSTWPTDANVSALAVSPDGKLLACGLADGAIEIRDALTGKPVGRLAGHKGLVYDVQFSPDGARIVSSSDDASVRVWSVDQRVQLIQLVAFTQHKHAVGGAAFSPDGNLVASCSYERPSGVVGTVHVWNSADGTLVRTLEGGRKPLTSIRFSPDGKQLAASSWDFCIFTWDVEGGEARKLAIPDEGIYRAADAVAFSPDGKLVACASKDKTARVFRTTDGVLTTTLRGHGDQVNDVAFSPDGSMIATASHDTTIRLWNADGSPRGTLHAHSGPVIALAFTPDGKRIMSSGSDGTVRTWDALASGYDGVRMTSTAACYVTRLSPDDTRLATCGYDGRIQMWSTATWELLAAWQAHAKQTSCHMLDWAPDGTWLASGSYDKTVRLWDAVTLEEIARLDHEVALYALAASPDGRTLVSAGGARVFVWDVATRTLARELKGHKKSVQTLAFSPDSKRVASAAHDGKAIVFDVANGSAVCEIVPGVAELMSAAFTADGAAVVVGDGSGGLGLYSGKDGKLVRNLLGGEHSINHVAVSADGKRVAVATDVLALVDIATAQPLASFRVHADGPWDLDFDARGEMLVSCSTDRSIAVTDTRPLAIRSTQREAYEKARRPADAHIEAWFKAGKSAAEMVQAVREDGRLSKEARTALLDAVTSLVGKTKP